MSLSSQQLLLNQILFSLEAGQSLEKSLEFIKNQNLPQSLKVFVEDFHFYLKRGYSHEKFLFQKYFHAALVPYLALGFERQQFHLFLKSAVKTAEQQTQLQSRFLQLCLYPAILLGVMLIFFGLAIWYLIPQMKTLFVDMNMPVPPAMLFLERLPWTVLIFCFVLSAGIFLLTRIDSEKRFRTALYKKIQSRGMKISFFYVAAFLPFLSAWVSFLKSGLNEEEALNTALPLLPQILQDDFRHLSLGLKTGYPLAQLVAGMPFMPKLIKAYIQSSAQNENLLPVLEFLQVYLNDLQNKNLKWLLTWAEPLLMILMGGLVAEFLMIIFMPFLNLSQNYGVML